MCNIKLIELDGKYQTNFTALLNHKEDKSVKSQGTLTTSVFISSGLSLVSHLSNVLLELTTQYDYLLHFSCKKNS